MTKYLRTKKKFKITSEKMTVKEAMIEKNLICDPTLPSDAKGYIVTNPEDETEYWFFSEEFINLNYDITEF